MEHIVVHNKKDLLVTLADHNYFDQAKQLFSSVYFNAGWQGDYMLLAYCLTESELRWFREKGILVKDCEALYDAVNIGKWPLVVLSKFFLFLPEFRQWQRIIFLDADIIVRNSLDSLLLRCTGGLYAVPSGILSKLFIGVTQAKIMSVPTFLIQKIRKEFDISTPTFNTGVMAFDTDIIDAGTFDALRTYIEFFPVSASGEELILNLFFYKKWRALPSIFNLYPDYLMREVRMSSAEIDGIILHFVLEKPWHTQSPYYGEWKRNFERASLIDLAHRPEGNRTWSKDEESTEQSFIDARMKRYIWRRKFFALRREIDRYIGLMGLFLKKYFPWVYFVCKYFQKTVQSWIV